VKGGKWRRRERRDREEGKGRGEGGGGNWIQYWGKKREKRSGRDWDRE
jgi:hypothetical protein